MQQVQIHNQDDDPTQRKLEKKQGFISKLKKMLLDQKFKEIIYILESNDGFIILNLQKFIDQALPEYFKHINYQSFRRQLNYYGFKCLNKEKNSVEYVNKQFNIHSETQIKKIIKQNSEVNDFASSFNQLEELRLNQLNLHKQIEEIKKLQEKIMKNTQQNTIVTFKFNFNRNIYNHKLEVNFVGKICNIFVQDSIKALVIHILVYYCNIKEQFFDKNFLNAAKQTQYAYDDDFFIKYFFQYQPIQLCCNKNQEIDSNNMKDSINQCTSFQNDENQFDEKLSVSNLSAYFDL